MLSLYSYIPHSTCQDYNSPKTTTIKRFRPDPTSFSAFGISSCAVNGPLVSLAPDLFGCSASSRHGYTRRCCRYLLPKWSTSGAISSSSVQSGQWLSRAEPNNLSTSSPKLQSKFPKQWIPTRRRREANVRPSIQGGQAQV